MGRFLLDGLGLGGLFGTLAGLLPSLLNAGFIWSQAPLLMIPVGGVIGSTYGLTLALLAWPIGRLLVMLRVVRRKGLALGVGVALVALVLILAARPVGGFWDADGVDALILALVPGVVASMVALVAGLRYDKSTEGIRRA